MAWWGARVLEVWPLGGIFICNYWSTSHWELSWFPHLFVTPWCNPVLVAIRTVLSRTVFVSHVVRGRGGGKGRAEKGKETRAEARALGASPACFCPWQELGLSPVVMYHLKTGVLLLWALGWHTERV